MTNISTMSDSHSHSIFKTTVLPVSVTTATTMTTAVTSSTIMTELSTDLGRR